MQQKISQQYSDQYIRIMEEDSHGRLVSLNGIYNEYGRPKYLSPKRVMTTRSFREFVEYVINRNNMEIEKVIRYESDDILVCGHIGIKYLNQLDPKNYVLSLLILKQSYGGWEGMFKAFNNDKNTLI